jgi:hypothetical protein
MLVDSHLLAILKIIVFSSVLFVWVIRYQNIVEEFKFFQYPHWLRDLVGIVKISFVIMIMSQDVFLVQFGAAGIAILMMAAIVTHIRVKNPLAKMLPSMTLLGSSGLIYYFSL